MLLKILKSSVDYLEGRAHAPDLSRRDFIQQGLNVGGVFLTLPVWASIFRTDRALADAVSAAEAVNPYSFTFEENTGGAGFSHVFGVTLENNVLYEGVNTKSLGIRANQSWRKDLVRGLAFHNRDSYLPTLLAGGAANIPGLTTTAFMNSGMAAQLLSRTAGFRIACAKNDDTGENKVNPLKLVQAFRQGTLMRTVGGRSDLSSKELSGARSVEIVSAYDVNGLVNSVNLQNGRLNTAAHGASVMAASARLSAAQNGNRPGRVGFAEMMSNIASASAGVSEKFDPNLAARAMNPMHADQAAAVAAVLDFSALSTREQVIFSAFLANARGIAGSAYVRNDGYDYHNSARDEAEKKHVEMARVDLLWMAAQQIAGKPGMKYRSTDGGIGWSDEDAPRALGDRGGAGLGICMIFQPAGVSSLAIRDVGFFLPTSGGGGEAPQRQVFVSRDPRHEGICALVNWAKLAGLDLPTVKSMVSDVVTNDADFNSLYAV